MGEDVLLELQRQNEQLTSGRQKLEEIDSELDLAWKVLLFSLHCVCSPECPV